MWKICTRCWRRQDWTTARRRASNWRRRITTSLPTLSLPPTLSLLLLHIDHSARNRFPTRRSRRECHSSLTIKNLGFALASCTPITQPDRGRRSCYAGRGCGRCVETTRRGIRATKESCRVAERCIAVRILSSIAPASTSGLSAALSDAFRPLSGLLDSFPESFERLKNVRATGKGLSCRSSKDD